MQDAREFGWNINGDITFDWKRLIANKVSRFQDHGSRALDNHTESGSTSC